MKGSLPEADLYLLFFLFLLPIHLGEKGQPK